MKKEHLLSLLYIPLTLCASVPSKRVAEETVSINRNVEAENPQELLDNAQRILKDAVNQQLNEMDINEGELWANTADDIQKMLESYYLDEYLMDEPVLNEDAPSDLFGGLFDGPEKGVKGIADGITSGLTGKPPQDTGTLKDKKTVNDTKVDTSVVESQNKTESGKKDFLGDLLGGLASVSNDLKNGTNGLHNPTNGSFPLHIPNLLNSTGGPPDLIHGIVSGVTNGTNGIVSGVTNGTNGIVSGITNGTNGLFGDKGLSNFGNGTGLEDAVGAVGSAFGKLFNGGLLPNPGNKTGDLLNGGLLPNPGNKTGDFFKGVGDKVASFFPDPKTYQGVFLGPLIGGVLDMLGTAVAGLLKGLGGFVINIFPKVGALGAQQLPGFLRLQTHDNLVEDLSHLKNTFLGAMRLESPVAADQFNIFFDKFYTVLERAHSADPSMAEALTSPTEENIRVALQSLSKVISDF